MKKIVIVAVTFALAASPASTVKFTADQCRVLKQMKIDTTGICPPTTATAKKK